jgi:Domain of unknown function (DUF5655)
VTTWTCPACDRRFARVGQGHECRPVVALADWYAARPDWVRAVCEPVLAHLDDLGDDLFVDPAEVGLIVKRPSSFVELRPRTKWVDLLVKLYRRVEDHRVARTMTGQRSAWTVHVVRLREPADVDEQVQDWLTESYLDADTD